MSERIFRSNRFQRKLLTIWWCTSKPDCLLGAALYSAAVAGNVSHQWNTTGPCLRSVPSLLCSPCPLAGGSPLGLCLGAEQKSRTQWNFLGFFQVCHLCLPVAISCCTVGFKLLRMGPCSCYSCKWCSSWSEPQAQLSWPKPWMLLVIAAHWAVQAVPERMPLIEKFPFGFDLESMWMHQFFRHCHLKEQQGQCCQLWFQLQLQDPGLGLLSTFRVLWACKCVPAPLEAGLLETGSLWDSPEQ